MNKHLYAQLAARLDNSLLTNKAIECLTVKNPQLTVRDAYQIQSKGILLRQKRGEKIIGYKMGLTSSAKQKQMNVTAPISGVLTDKMQINDNQTISVNKCIQPKAEMEIAFITKNDLRGNVAADEALLACGGVCAAIEIIDSRYLDFKFTLIDVIADNCSASGFVLGPIIQITGIDFATLGMDFIVNQTVIEHGSSGAVSGNPVNSLILLVQQLTDQGLYLKAGSIVLTGTPTNAITLTADQHLVNKTETLGSASIFCRD